MILPRPALAPQHAPIDTTGHAKHLGLAMAGSSALHEQVELGRQGPSGASLDLLAASLSAPALHRLISLDLQLALALLDRLFWLSWCPATQRLYDLLLSVNRNPALPGSYRKWAELQLGKHPAITLSHAEEQRVGKRLRQVELDHLAGLSLRMLRSLPPGVVLATSPLLLLDLALVTPPSLVPYLYLDFILLADAALEPLEPLARHGTQIFHARLVAQQALTLRSTVR